MWKSELTGDADLCLEDTANNDRKIFGQEGNNEAESGIHKSLVGLCDLIRRAGAKEVNVSGIDDHNGGKDNQAGEEEADDGADDEVDNVVCGFKAGGDGAWLGEG